MGDYVQFVFNAELRLEKMAEDGALAALKWLLDPQAKNLPAALPNHPLFTGQNGQGFPGVLWTNSSYHPVVPHSVLAEDVLSVRSQPKYGRGIDEFLDWISPYVYAWPGDFLGFTLSEYLNVPTLIYAGNAIAKGGAVDGQPITVEVATCMTTKVLVVVDPHFTPRRK